MVWLSGAAQLTTALLFGGSLLYSAAFAAFLFTALPAAQAGLVLRRAFSVYYLWLIATSLVGALLLLAIDVRSSAILAAIALTTIPLRQVLMPAINAASDDGNRRRFQWLHSVSVLGGLSQIAAMAYVLLRL